MIDDVATNPSDHLLDLICRCGHVHTEHRNGYGPCLSDDQDCGCSRFRIAQDRELTSTDYDEAQDAEQANDLE